MTVQTQMQQLYCQLAEQRKGIATQLEGCYQQIIEEEPQFNQS